MNGRGFTFRLSWIVWCHFVTILKQGPLWPAGGDDGMGRGHAIVEATWSIFRDPFWQRCALTQAKVKVWWPLHIFQREWAEIRSCGLHAPWLVRAWQWCYSTVIYWWEFLVCQGLASLWSGFGLQKPPAIRTVCVVQKNAATSMVFQKTKKNQTITIMQFNVSNNDSSISIWKCMREGGVSIPT